MVLLILATELIVWGRACESRVELKHYPIPYFNHIAVFEAPYHQTGRVHTCFIDTQISNVSSKCVWAPPLREFSDAALNAAKYTMEWSLISTLDCHIRVCAIPIVTQVALRPPDLASSQYTSKPLQFMLPSNYSSAMFIPALWFLKESPSKTVLKNFNAGSLRFSPHYAPIKEYSWISTLFWVDFVLPPILLSCSEGFHIFTICSSLLNHCFGHQGKILSLLHITN